MKKTLVLVLFFCLVSGAQAQHFKLIAGPAVSHYSDEWPPSGVWLDSVHLNPFENLRIGFFAGCGVEFTLNKKVSLEIDGLYFQNGSTFESDYPFYYSHRDVYILSGLSVPLLIKLKLLSGPFPYFMGGLEFSYVVAHSRISYYRSETNPRWVQGWKEDLLDSTHRFDFGPVVGLGFEVKVARVFLFFETRYSLGLVDLSVRHGFFWPKIRTSSLVLLSGLKFS